MYTTFNTEQGHPLIHVVSPHWQIISGFAEDIDSYYEFEYTGTASSWYTCKTKQIVDTCSPYFAHVFDLKCREGMTLISNLELAVPFGEINKFREAFPLN